MSKPIIIKTHSERMEISQEDVITIMEIARIALEDKNIGWKIGHELDLSDEELDRIYEIVEIKEDKANE